jgi:hypothetical protein
LHARCARKEKILKVFIQKTSVSGSYEMKMATSSKTQRVKPKENHILIRRKILQINLIPRKQQTVLNSND